VQIFDITMSPSQPKVTALQFAHRQGNFDAQ
jgi:hypothetical protein